MDRLPTELHIAVRNEILKDPDTTFDEYKSLRLVCRSFNEVWSPIVLCNITLFPRNPRDDRLLQRLPLLFSGTNNSMGFRTLTLKNWHHLDTTIRRYLRRLGKLWQTDLALALVLTPLIPILAPLVATRFIIWPKESATPVLNFIKARFYSSALYRKLCFPNVTHARIFHRSTESRFGVYCTSRILVMLPQLTKLELQLSHGTDMAYISTRLRALCSLNEFSLTFHASTKAVNKSSDPSCFSTVIARNPYLTRLTFRSISDVPCNLSQILREIPENRPLQLEHVAIDDHCTNVDALLPHIKMLSSFQIICTQKHTPATAWYATLQLAQVFPPTIMTGSLDAETCMYLEKHPGLVNLSIAQIEDEALFHNPLSKILARHCDTLQYLALPSHTLTLTLQSIEDEAIFLRCTKLRELVLKEDDFYQPWSLFWRGQQSGSIWHESLILPIVARFDRPPTVVIARRCILGFNKCVEYCRATGDPLVRDLAGRIVYECSDI